MKRAPIFLLLLLVSGIISAQNVDYAKQAKDLVAKMTLEEKAGLCSGATAWTTKPIDRLGIPSIFMTDGPHGLRKANGFDFTNSVPATCFPTASALAASWNTELVQKVGDALGLESQANDVQILLGPGVNMKRSPLGGRNFEYFSEDPVLSGKMAVALINGVQGQGVGTSLKHFAANNQEYERMTMNSNLDHRTLHEIYLPAFEMAVKDAHPWTLMCSYNRINGVFGSENTYLLTDVLRKKWGYKGAVVSDWGAVVDRPSGVKAGLNLEMPSSGGVNDKKIVEAVKSGQLKESTLDSLVTDMLALTLKAKAAARKGVTFRASDHHELARQVAGECAVLLKNDNHILPVGPNTKSIALIGGFAKTPRYQGSGSSQVKPTQISNVYDELVKSLGSSVQINYAQGYDAEGNTDDKMLAEAVQLASQAEVVLFFGGLPSSYESEGFDRNNMDMPAGQNLLIEAIAAAQPNTAVILMNGSAVSMPWAGKVRGILEAWLGGQAGGAALVDVLTGLVNPSGKLSETFPVRLEDTPSYLDFPAKNGEARYGEGIFIGYRYYDTKKIEPLFPFGFGLSYTTFEYTSIKVDKKDIRDNEELTVSVTVKNTGLIPGKEVVQLYVHDPKDVVLRPEKELKQFAKVTLKAGEEKTVRFKLGFRDFAYFNSTIDDWQVPGGAFEIQVGGSSRNLPLKQSVTVQNTQSKFPPLTRYSMLKEFRDNPAGKPVYDRILANMVTQPGVKQSPEEIKKAKEMFATFLNDMPIYKMIAMSQGQFNEEALQQILKMLNP